MEIHNVIRRSLPHPAIVLLAWVTVIILLQGMSVYPLMISGVLLLTLAGLLSQAELLSLLRRSRWLILAIVLMYGYADRDELIWPLLQMFSPGREGMVAGLVQSTRLIMMIASVSLLLKLMTEQEWLCGLYVLAWPMQLLGSSREKFAVRLALTIAYARERQHTQESGLYEAIKSVKNVSELSVDTLKMIQRKFTVRDGGCILALVVLVAGMYP